MNNMKNFSIGMLSSFGLSQAIVADNLLNSVVSILGGVLSTVAVAFLQHYWQKKKNKK
jgi:hypothetical protein